MTPENKFQPPTQPTQVEEEQRACPVCQGGGSIPASMSRDEILQAVDQNMPTADNPELGEMYAAEKPANPFSRTPEMNQDQRTEVDRLNAHAKGRMGERNISY